MAFQPDTLPTRQLPPIQQFGRITFCLGEVDYIEEFMPIYAETSRAIAKDLTRIFGSRFVLKDQDIEYERHFEVMFASGGVNQGSVTLDIALLVGTVLTPPYIFVRDYPSLREGAIQLRSDIKGWAAKRLNSRGVRSNDQADLAPVGRPVTAKTRIEPIVMDIVEDPQDVLNGYGMDAECEKFSFDVEYDD